MSFLTDDAKIALYQQVITNMAANNGLITLKLPAPSEPIRLTPRLPPVPPFVAHQNERPDQG